jgi:hypothetical protein
MAAKVTFKVARISPVGNNQAQVTFLVTADVGGAVAISLNGANLTSPRDVGKEFELDDEYSIEIAPKPGANH